MSFLFPLFLAGIAAVSLPIILHMIRRHTRRRVMFSSLMFLHTTPPRLKNRGRLEQIPLLILRCIILCLLAFIFSRPFLKQNAENLQAPVGRRIVLLLDTSASMQRQDLWEQLLEQAEAVLDDIELTDRLCVISFDQNTNILIGFESWAQMEPQQRIPVISEEISVLSPTWASTNLGNALVTAAEAIEDDEINDQFAGNIQKQIILLSDLQIGSNIEALYSYAWPEEIELVVEQLSAKGTTNASLQIVTDGDALVRSDQATRPRVRVTNSENSISERFLLSWADDAPAFASTEPIEVYVPPGHSIVTEVPAEPNGLSGQKLILTGDDHDFDNTLYLAPNIEQKLNILYIGNTQAADSSQMLYYIQRVFQPTTVINPVVVSHGADEPLSDADISSADLIIITDAVMPDNIRALRSRLESGSNMLLAMKSVDSAETIAALAGLEDMDAEEADVYDYAMLQTIDFTHPLLTTFSDPLFSNFSKIHFWKYRKINIDNIPDVRVLASFDNEDPALVEFQAGQGSLLVLTSGWNPSDSQLALSSKFVPILYSLLEYNGVFDGRQSQYYVSQNIYMPEIDSSQQQQIRIRKPDDSLATLDTEQQFFTQADMPGIYSIETDGSEQIFAVNLSVDECRTSILSLEEVEQLGVLFDNTSEAQIQHNEMERKYSSFVEMENQQKFWRWLLIALLATLLIETFLAGWLTRPAKEVSEVEK